jgi:hypothetical protein
MCLGVILAIVCLVCLWLISPALMVLVLAFLLLVAWAGRR